MAFRRRRAFRKKNFRKRPFRRFNKRRQRATTSSLTFRRSNLTHQPWPDRYFTTLMVENFGYYGTSTGQSDYFGMALNILPYPFNTVGGITNKLPNPKVATNSCDPAGLENLLYNSATNTGLWLNYRVWGATVRINCQPQATGDALQFGIAPVVTASANYGSLQTLSQGPNSKWIVCTANNTARGNTIIKHFSIPQILGISKRAYGTPATATYGTYGTAPSSANQVFAQVFYNTQDESTNSGPIGFSVSIKYHVEFWGRTDTAIIDA